MKIKSIVFVANSLWYLNNFRLDTIRKVVEIGYDAHIGGDSRWLGQDIRMDGVTVHSCNSGSNNFNLFKHIVSFVQFFLVIRKIRADYCFSFTTKGNIYSGIVCRLLGIKLVANISGLGGMASSSVLMLRLFFLIYRISVSSATQVFFQNGSDLKKFTSSRRAAKYNVSILPGSGVNLQYFNFSEMPSCSPISFLFCSRLLIAKGVYDYFDAVKDLTCFYGLDVQFRIAGLLENTNEYICKKELLRLCAQHNVEYLGALSDVRDAIRSCDCIVLPTRYNEGVPKILIEAASMGRPAIASTADGCKEVVIEGLTGYLCDLNRHGELKSAMRKFIEASVEDRTSMGRAARRLAEVKFDIALTILPYIQVIEEFEFSQEL